MGCRRRRVQLPCDLGRPGGVDFHQQGKDALLADRELGRRDRVARLRRRRGGLLWHLDRDHRPTAEVVFDRDHAAEEGERLARHRQPRPDATDEEPLVGGGGREPGLERALLVGDAGAVVGDAHHAAAVEDRDPTSRKRAWMRFSMNSVMTVYGTVPPCSRHEW